MRKKTLPKDAQSSDADSKPLVILLPAIMTIETAEAVSQEWKQLPFDAVTHMTVDASQVEAITTPGLQLIVSLAKTLAALGASLTISHHKESFAQALKDSGLEYLAATSS